MDSQEMIRVPLVRMKMIKERSLQYRPDAASKALNTPGKLANFISAIYRDIDREQIYVCCLNNRLEPVNIRLAAAGGVSCCNVMIPELFKAAILSNSNYVVMFHNHPGGDPAPSQEDRAITERVREAAKILEIELLDHIILGDGDYYYSFREEEWK